jgi:hypothetical protein
MKERKMGSKTRSWNTVAFVRFAVSKAKSELDNLKSESTRQAMNEAHSCNQCCSAKAIPITYSVFVSVALGNHHVMRMRCHLWPVRLYNIFSNQEYFLNIT